MNKSKNLIKEINILEKEIWNSKNPNTKHRKLTPEQKSKAKARAKKAGRPYPNAVDNIWASKE